MSAANPIPTDTESQLRVELQFEREAAAALAAENASLRDALADARSAKEAAIGAAEERLRLYRRTQAELAVLCEVREWFARYVETTDPWLDRCDFLANCQVCDGLGGEHDEETGTADPWEMPCPDCAGTGKQEVKS